MEGGIFQIALGKPANSSIFDLFVQIHGQTFWHADAKPHPASDGIGARRLGLSRVGRPLLVLWLCLCHFEAPFVGAAQPKWQTAAHCALRNGRKQLDVGRIDKECW